MSRGGYPETVVGTWGKAVYSRDFCSIFFYLPYSPEPHDVYSAVAFIHFTLDHGYWQEMGFGLDGAGEWRVSHKTFIMDEKVIRSGGREGDLISWEVLS